MIFSQEGAPTHPPGVIPSGTQWDFSTTGIPWLDWLIDLVVVCGVLVGAGLLVYSRAIAPQLKEIRKNSATAAEQTSNDHQNAEYPNLRENIDANQKENRAAFAKSLERMDSLAEALTRLDAKQEMTFKQVGEVQQKLWETKARVTALESRSPPTGPTSSIKPPS